MLIFKQHARLEEVTEPLNFGFNPFLDQGCGWAEQVNLDGRLGAPGGILPDALNGTVDQDDCRDPSLRAEDQALVDASEELLALTRRADRIRVEEREQVDRLRRFETLHHIRGCSQSDCPPPFDIDLFQLIFHRLKELSCLAFSSPIPAPARKVFCGRRTLCPQIAADHFPDCLLWLDRWPFVNPRSGIDKRDVLPLFWSETEVAADSRLFQGGTPA